jgi:cation transport ATPase
MNSKSTPAAGNDFRRPSERTRIVTSKPIPRSVSKERLLEMKQKKERELHRINQEIQRREVEEYEQNQEKERKEREEYQARLIRNQKQAELERKRLEDEKKDLERRIKEEQIKRKETLFVALVIILNVWMPGLGIFILSLISGKKMKNFLLVALGQFLFYLIFDGYFNFWVSIVIVRISPLLACLNEMKNKTSDGKINFLKSDVFEEFLKNYS